jgi:hypothetical protein
MLEDEFYIVLGTLDRLLFSASKTTVRSWPTFC